MTYKIIISPRAQKNMAKFPKANGEKIRDKIKELAVNPRPRWLEKLKTRLGFRIPVGDYRVVYNINDDEKIVSILDVNDRKNVYK